jgi:hypothetical protein
MTSLAVTEISIRCSLGIGREWLQQWSAVCLPSFSNNELHGVGSPPQGPRFVATTGGSRKPGIRPGRYHRWAMLGGVLDWLTAWL